MPALRRAHGLLIDATAILAILIVSVGGVEKEFNSHKGIDCADPTVQNYPDVDAPDTCQAKCAEKETCRAFSFDLNSRECFLKEHCDFPEERNGFYSGVQKGLDDNGVQLQVTRTSSIEVEEEQQTTAATAPGRGTLVSSTWTFSALDTSRFIDEASQSRFRSDMQMNLATAAGISEQDVTVTFALSPDNNAAITTDASVQAAVTMLFQSEQDITNFALQLVSAPSSLLTASALQRYGSARVSGVSISLNVGEVPKVPDATTSPSPLSTTDTANATPFPTPSPSAPTLSQTPTAPAFPVPTAIFTYPPTASPSPYPSSSFAVGLPISKPTPSPTTASWVPSTTPANLNHEPVQYDPVIPEPLHEPVKEFAGATDESKGLYSDTLPSVLPIEMQNTAENALGNSATDEKEAPASKRQMNFAVITLVAFLVIALLVLLSFGGVYYILCKRENDRSTVKEITAEDGISTVAGDDPEEQSFRELHERGPMQQLGATNNFSVWDIQGINSIQNSLDGSLAPSNLSGTWHWMVNLPGTASAWRGMARSSNRRQSIARDVVTPELNEEAEAETARMLPQWWGGSSPWWLHDSSTRQHGNLNSECWHDHSQQF